MKIEVTPAYLLRSYTWEVLKANDPTVWDASKYGGLTPIVPLAEEMELTQYDGPHIVYGYALNPMGDLYARRFGSMTFAIYDQNFRRLTKTVGILSEALGRLDETARDVNNFTVNYDPNADQSYPYRGLTFGYVELGFVEGGTPEQTEGGRQSALVNVRFEYHVEYDVITSV